MPLSFAPMPRGAFTGFQMISLFSLSLWAGSGKLCVTARPINETSRYPQRTNREEWLFPPDRTSSAALITIILPCRWFVPFHASNYAFSFWWLPFTDFFSEVLSNSICLCFRLPPSCAFQGAASVSHFRSGRKGNSGIGRESKVKPPVFGKNLQPFG